MDERSQSHPDTRPDTRPESRDERLAQAAALRAAGDGRAAEAVYRRMIAADERDAEPHHLLAGMLAATGALRGAEAEYRRTLELAPSAASTARVLATLLLSQGRYAEGFALYEARHAAPHLAKPPLPYPEWTGQDLAGKRLLIWPEQGFGDQIQFARFAPILQRAGVDVTLLCAAPLTRLFAGCLGVRVLSAEGEVEFPAPDHWVMTCSLAARMGVEPATIPGAPYLHALDPPPGPAAEGPAGARIGVMTAGNPTNLNDANRSLPPEVAARLADLPGAVDLGPARTGARDFADTAAILAGLDLVITVDTAVAHLAGAMGKPVWILIPDTGADWRWLRRRTDSPWYPTARLYRQGAADSWAAVVERVVADAAGLGPDGPGARSR